jgi:DNA-binding transcriptional ArsR family regulator
MEIQIAQPLPASARLLLRVLRDLKVSDLKTLQKETGLSRRAIMYAVKKLKEADLVEVQICLTDSRRRYYCIRANI